MGLGGGFTACTFSYFNHCLYNYYHIITSTLCPEILNNTLQTDHINFRRQKALFRWCNITSVMSWFHISACPLITTKQRGVCDSTGVIWEGGGILYSHWLEVNIFPHVTHVTQVNACCVCGVEWPVKHYFANNVWRSGDEHGTWTHVHGENCLQNFSTVMYIREEAS